MRDALDRIRLAHAHNRSSDRIDHLSPVRGWCRMQDAVRARDRADDVARGHVDLGAQHARAVLEIRRLSCGETGRRLSSIERLRNGLFLPGSVSVPRLARISSCDWSST